MAQRQLHKSLVKRFSQTISTQFTGPGVPISAQLASDLKRQQQRIAQVVRRKCQTNQNMASIEANNLQYRSELSKRIKDLHQKHFKHRNEFIDRRVKEEQRKLKYVEQVHSKFQKMQMEKKKLSRNQSQKNKEEMVTFWDVRKALDEKKVRSQSASSPLYVNAVQRKKRFEADNESYALRIKNQLLAKHLPIKSHVQQIITRRQEQIHDAHNEQASVNLSRNQDFQKGKEEKHINSIGLRLSRSQRLLRRNKEERRKEIQRRQAFSQDIKSRAKSSFLERNKSKASKLKDCRCWSKGHQKQSTTAVVLKNQEPKGTEIKERPTYGKSEKNQFMASTKSFLDKDFVNLGRAQSRRASMTKTRNWQSERELLREKEISKAIRVKKDIRQQANNLIRKGSFF